MKKFYSALLALTLVLGATSCAPSFSEEVLEDKSVGGYAILGPKSHKVGDKFIADWGGYDGTTGTMAATSLAEVAKLSTDLAKSIQDKGAVAVYKLDDIHVATDALAGWKTTWGADGAEIDGAYCLKAGAWNFDAENNKNAVALWVPSKESGKVLTLTPDTYWVTPNFAEEKDEHGYDWNTNPVITKGAGTYTMVLAKFGAPVDDATYGIGMVKTAEGSEYVPATFKNWKLTGTMNGWKESSVDDGSHFDADGKLTFTFEKDAEFKVTQFLSDNTGTWDGALAFADVKDPIAEVVDSNGNIKITAAGEYKLAVVKEGEVNKVTITK